MTKPKVPTINKVQLQLSKAMNEILKLDPQRTNIEAELESATTLVLNWRPLTKSMVDTKIDTLSNDVASSFKTASEMSSYDDKINNIFNNESIPSYRFIYPVNTVSTTDTSEINSTLLASLFPTTKWYLYDGYYYRKS